MAIRMRRGNYSDFDPTRMQSGEWAVCLDNGYIYMTLSPGNVIRIGTYEAIAEALARAEEYASDSEAYAIGKRDGSDVPSTDPAYHNNSLYFSDIADDRAVDSEAWAVGERAGVPVTSGDETYQNNSKYYAGIAEDCRDYVEDVVEEHAPNFTIDWTTGELLYSGGYFTMWVDSNGFLKWGVEPE